jgi:hypothetical protein
LDCRAQRNDRSEFRVWGTFFRRTGLARKPGAAKRTATTGDRTHGKATVTGKTPATPEATAPST